ncbi:hypothetical protein [Paenibacillus larvae]|uniref:Uncharacterized protein n=2 Tax=root TaxID=1 RepID=A0A2I7SC19_9CAUD|nr:hypothetical protein [Paenibacillus larvae]YP_010080200.1 hypothetical protein KMC72_gp47 [Paenibacillus phage Dragolir]AUS03447.1 hypothetical protein DRAGOLIR_47 [Paenibacillus phage Dragolir]ETK27218.1 hypothetical protein ERIC1_1c06610 [Paenibacillus larvae subsp. larvae DSM 25719]MCY9563230.1 hypothetical protein [Paenibacillus larvae]MCY9569040.1 hypothetical protein [Paenibacillus larvae]MCY9571127.1 hypothetical protein [Paenibacillus larvae]
MRYGIKLNGSLEETYDTPEEAYHAAELRCGDTGLFYEVVAVTSLMETVSKLQSKLEDSLKRELELMNALMEVKGTLRWGDAENAVSKATYHIDKTLEEFLKEEALINESNRNCKEIG